MDTIFNDLSPESKVWIYQNTAPIAEENLAAIQAEVQQFVQNWTAHNHQLKAKAAVLYNRFIVLMVDETGTAASGCSIDKSVHFMESLQMKYGLNLFDRFNFSYEKDGEVRSAGREQFAALFQEGMLEEKTYVFNNLVKTKAEFESKWKVPLGESWHKNFV